MAFPPNFKSTRRTNATPVGKKAGEENADHEAKEAPAFEKKEEKAVNNEFVDSKKKKSKGAPPQKNGKTGFASLPAKFPVKK